MSYLNRIWMAASVAVVNGHTDPVCKLKSGLKSLHHGKKRFSASPVEAGGNPADLRPISSLLDSDLGGFLGSSGGGEERTKQADDSLRQEKTTRCVSETEKSLLPARSRRRRKH
ncbi:hypothetical protein U1Q18_001436, partial [Sarracenia purpurea var. burkii]